MKRIIAFGVLSLGIVFLAGCGQQVVGQQPTTPAPVAQQPSTNQPVDETAGWQKYKNDEYKFEVKYPQDAKVILSPKSGGIVYIGTTSSGLNEYNYGITFSFLGSVDDKSAENWYLQYYQDRKREATKADVPFLLSDDGQNVLINGYSAYKTVDFGFDHGIVNFYMVHNENIEVLTYEDQLANDPKWNEHEKMINQILSTFKFTDDTIPEQSETNTSNGSGLKICPDEWGDNQMPSDEPGGEERQYYILDGKRREINEFDSIWVRDNCNLEKQVVW